jgi:hypothetical protein
MRYGRHANESHLTPVEAALFSLVLNTQPFVHDGTGCRVLHVDFLVWFYALFDRKCCQRRFVKTAQNEFLLK